jgi:SAM-dependent methyltransferase
MGGRSFGRPRPTPVTPGLLSDAPKLLAPVATVYDLQLDHHGIEARGVLWRNEENQRMRFEVLAGIIEAEDDKGGITVNDLGCGYGAFFTFLEDRPAMTDGRYYGYDISEDMVKAARQSIQDRRVTFSHSLVATHYADYSFASGTYNLKLDNDEAAWKKYVKESLIHLWARTQRALAFNMLSIYGSERQGGLLYADPGEFFDFCIREISPNVVLFHDYSPIDWTIWLRK